MNVVENGKCILFIFARSAFPCPHIRNFYAFIVASKLVSIGKHTLPGGVEVEITFPACKDSDTEDETEDGDSEGQPGLCLLRKSKLSWNPSRSLGITLISH